jgi:hypothetical protein
MYKLVILFVFISSFLFYWYEIRPASTRSGCVKSVLENGMYATSEIEKDQLKSDMNKINSYEREKSKFYYEECLHRAGLEK